MSRLEAVRASPRPDTGGWGFRATRNRDLGRLAIVAGSYVVSARIGLSLSVAHGSATPVWAPTGISLAALLLFGRKVWPAVFVGAFLANSMTPVPISLAFAIAVGNTAEALLGWFLLTRIGFRNGLDRVHDVIALVVGAAVLSTAVSATVGVTASLLAGTIASSTYLQHWGIWWVGDMMGDLLVASLLLVWVGRWDDWRGSRALEAIVLLALLVSVSAFVFAGSHSVPATRSNARRLRDGGDRALADRRRRRSRRPCRPDRGGRGVPGAVRLRRGLPPHRGRDHVRACRRGGDPRGA